MKYSQFRIAVLTFVFGIASVSFFNAEYDVWTEIPVDLPQVVSKSPMLIYVETEGHHFRMFGGSGCGGRKEVIWSKPKHTIKQVKSHYRKR